MSFPRKTALVMGQNQIPSPSGNLGVPGSYAGGGTELFNADLAVLQNTAWLNGLSTWLVGTPNGLSSPVLFEIASAFLVVTQQLAYILARGIPEWDSTTGTLYNGGDYVRRDASGDQRTLYRVKNGSTNISSDPLTDSANWEPYANTLSGPTIIKAWARFNGTTVGTITPSAAFGITSITRTSAGLYVANFSISMPVDGSGNGTYGGFGSCGTPNGVTPIAAGDNNHIIFGVPGIPAIKTASQCQFGAWEASTVGPPGYGPIGLEDSSDIFVGFYGSP